MESTPADPCPVSMPIWFLSHGPGPAWLLPAALLGPTLGHASKDSASAKHLKTYVQQHPLPSTPKAILVVSAHWEEAKFTVQTNRNPELLFDYYGFPDESYEVQWPAPGAPSDVIKRTLQLIRAAGLVPAEDADRGFDHGVFVPLTLVFPEAKIPVFEVSLKKSFRVGEHLQLGEALSPLRDEGVLIICSGHTTHNTMERAMEVQDYALVFRDWIHDVLSSPSLSNEERKQRLLSAPEQPSFRLCHPRPEHFLPMAVAAAAAGYQKGDITYDQFIMGSLLCSHVIYS